MSETVHLGLPYLAAAQAQKHVTHNEALSRLDALVQLSLIDADQASPPVSPADGDRYIVGAAPTGAFAGHAGEIAAFIDGAWAFFAPEEGWIAYDQAGGAALVRGASDWQPLSAAAEAGDVGFTPTGGLAATNVQAALAELDTEKAAVTAVRERLTANRTYYVRTDGSNANNGLANSAGGAFLTIQYAYNLIRSTLDLAGFVVTIQLGDGTYTAGVSLTGGLVGGLGSYLILKGNAGTPSSVVISTTSASCVLAGKGAYIKVQDLKLQTTTAGDCLGAYEFAQIEFANVVFGACATHHCEAWRYGTVNAVGSYTISGGAISHMHAYSMAYISIVSLTVTLTGTPAFSSWFAGNSQSNIACAAVTFSGSATGTRYLVHKNGVTDTSGGGANFFPGNAAGSAATGGVYA